MVKVENWDKFTTALDLSNRLAESLAGMKKDDAVRATAPIRSGLNEAQIMALFSPRSNPRAPSTVNALRRTFVLGTKEDYNQVAFALKRHIAKFKNLDAETLTDKTRLVKNDGKDTEAIFDDKAEFQQFIHEIQDAYDVNLNLDSKGLKNLKGLTRALVLIFRDTAGLAKSSVDS